jgi:hypothetical protein
MSSIFASIIFLAPSSGGRETALPIGRIGYILEAHSQSFSCWLLNTGSEKRATNNLIEYEIVLGAPEIAKSVLSVGTKFTLRDTRIVAEGEVTRLAT